MSLNPQTEVGAKLASVLAPFRDETASLLALVPRGVPLGIELARRLDLPLEVLITSELCLVGRRKMAIGAMSERGDFFLDLVAVREQQVSESALDHCTDRALLQIERRIGLYRSGSPLPDLYARTLILVSDGLSTLPTARVALASARRMMPRRLLFAAPMLSNEVFFALSPLTSAVYTIASPGELACDPSGPDCAADRTLEDEEAARALRQFRFEQSRRSPSADENEDSGEV